MTIRITALNMLALAAALTFTSCGDKKEDNPTPADNGNGVGNGSGTLTMGSKTYNLSNGFANNTGGQMGASASYVDLTTFKTYSVMFTVYNGTDPGTTSTEYTVAKESGGAMYAEVIITESGGTVGNTKSYRAPNGAKIKYNVVSGKKVLSVPVSTLEEVVAAGVVGGTLSAGGSVAWQ